MNIDWDIQGVPRHIGSLYSFKLPRLIRKSKKNGSFRKIVYCCFKDFNAENTRFFEYYVRILVLKLGDNPI